MHEPKASALSYRDRYCIVIKTLKHVILEKCDINITYLTLVLINHQSRINAGSKTSGRK